MAMSARRSPLARRWWLVCCWLLASSLVFAQPASSDSCEARMQSLSVRLASIETLLAGSIDRSYELEMRLNERLQQLTSLNERLRTLEQTNSVQSTELEQLNALQRQLSKEVTRLRIELERSKRRSETYRQLVSELLKEYQATQSELANSEKASSTLSESFESYRQTSETALFWANVEIWVYRGVIAGAAILATVLTLTR